MTGPLRAELERARAWSAELRVALDTAAREVGDLTRRLAAGWPDDHGREWTERLAAVRHALERDADEASRWSRDVERVADETEGSTGPAPLGPRLGGTGARRADDERGVRIPRLDHGPDG